MKQILLIFFILVCCFGEAKANKIDSLKTNKEVEDFIRPFLKKINTSPYYVFQLAKPDSVRDIFGCDSTVDRPALLWERMDFDNNGLTDLFAVIYEQDTVNADFPSYKVYVVLAQAGYNYQLQNIPNHWMVHCYSAIPMTVNKVPAISYRHYQTDYTLDTLPGVDTLYGTTVPRVRSNYFERGETDTLVFKFGSFIEWNPVSKELPAIRSIYCEITSGGPLGSSVTFNIFNEGTSYYTRHHSIEENSGNFRTVIDPAQWKEIAGLINYINLPSLDEYYIFHATHMPHAKLKVHFSDGTVKEINDDGLRGTLGLSRLFELLLDLRNNQAWK